jgi:hypothetical protein
VNSAVQIEPFGLTFRVPLPSSAAPSEAVRTAVYDQQSQMALFSGRPLSELSAQERMDSSSPTVDRLVRGASTVRVLPGFRSS